MSDSIVPNQTDETEEAEQEEQDNTVPIFAVNWEESEINDDTITQFIGWKKYKCTNNTEFEEWVSTINPNNIKKKLPIMTKDNIQKFFTPEEQKILRSFRAITTNYERQLPKEMASIHGFAWDEERHIATLSDDENIPKLKAIGMDTSFVPQGDNNNNNNDQSAKFHSEILKLSEELQKIKAQINAQKAKGKKVARANNTLDTQLEAVLTTLAMTRQVTVLEHPWEGTWPTHGKHTCQYIIELELHISLNNISIELMKLAEALKTAPKEDQIEYTESHDQDKRSFDSWKKFVLKKYAPTNQRSAYKKKLNGYIIPPDTNPAVYAVHLENQIAKIKKCIELYNNHRPVINGVVTSKIEDLTEEEKKEAFLNVFYHNNNQEKYGNTSYTNRQTVKQIEKANLIDSEYSEIVKFIKNLSTTIIKPMNVKHEWVPLHITPGLRNLLTKADAKINKPNKKRKFNAKADEGTPKKKHKTDPNTYKSYRGRGYKRGYRGKRRNKFQHYNNRGRGRGYHSRGRGRGRPNGRGKGKYYKTNTKDKICFRCGKPNHTKAECFSKYHKDGTELKDTPPAPKPNNDKTKNADKSKGKYPTYNPNKKLNHGGVDLLEQGETEEDVNVLNQLNEQYLGETFKIKVCKTFPKTYMLFLLLSHLIKTGYNETINTIKTYNPLYTFIKYNPFIEVPRMSKKERKYQIKLQNKIKRYNYKLKRKEKKRYKFLSRTITYKPPVQQIKEQWAKPYVKELKRKYNLFTPKDIDKFNDKINNLKLKSLFPSKYAHHLFKDKNNILRNCIILKSNNKGFLIQLTKPKKNEKRIHFLKNGTNRLLQYNSIREGKHIDNLTKNEFEQLLLPHDEINCLDLHDSEFGEDNNTHHEICTMETTCTTCIRPIQCNQPMEITHPFKEKVTVFTDTGASLNVINGKIATKYQQYLCKSPRPFFVRTANGRVTCQTYLPLKVRGKAIDFYAKNKRGTLPVPTKMVDAIAKFYVIPELKYEYLMGRRLQAALGMVHGNHAQIIEDWIHQRNEADDWGLTDKFEYPMAPGIYPIGDPEKDNKIDINAIKIKDPQLEPCIRKLLESHRTNLATHEMDSGRFQLKQHEFSIKFKEGIDTTPICCNEYSIPRQHKREIQRQIDALKDAGFITPANESPWRFPIFCVPKKTGDVRIVFDFRKLNALTKLNKYPLPNAIKEMHKFKGANYITSLDIKGGYWHVPVREEDREKLTFVFKNQSYKWNVLPFGPTNAPSHFQFVMTDIFRDFINDGWLVVYLDDISIISKTVEEHKDHLQQVFKKLRDNDIRLRLDKCIWGVSRTEYLGFIIDKTGITPTDKYKNKILKCTKPKNKKDVQCFLGLVNWLHRFIDHLHLLIHPLIKLTHNKQPFEWGPEQEDAFNKIKMVIEQPHFLHHPDPDKTFHLFCDASEKGIGGLLAQKDEKTGHFNPVEYSSKTFNTTQQNWHVSEQEIFAVVHFVEKWRYLLMNGEFVVHTDHLNLQELFNRAKNFKAGKLYRWAVRLQDYSFICKYLPGTKNCFADYLSRYTLSNDKIDKIPIEEAMRKINVENSKNGDPTLTILQSGSNTNKNNKTHDPDIMKRYSDFLLMEYIDKNNSFYLDDTIPCVQGQRQYDIDVCYPLHSVLANKIQDTRKIPKDAERPKPIGPDNNYKTDIDKTGYTFVKPKQYNENSNRILEYIESRKLIMPKMPKVPTYKNPDTSANIKLSNNNKEKLPLPILNNSAPHPNESVPNLEEIPKSDHSNKQNKDNFHSVHGKRRGIRFHKDVDYKEKEEDDIEIETDNNTMNNNINDDTSLKEFAEEHKDSKNHNTQVLVRYALDRQNKRYQTRYNKRVQYEINDETLKKLKLERTHDHKQGDTPKEHKKTDDANKKIALMNKYLIDNNKRPITHKIAISNTHVLDKLYKNPINSDIIKAKQIEDASLYAIIEFLKTNNSTLLLTLNASFMRTVLQGRYKYSESTGLTYNRQGKDLLVVPSYLRNHVLRYHHDNLIHNGNSRMKYSIISKYYWPGIDTDVRQHVKICDTCQNKQKSSPGDKNIIKLFPATKPFKMLHIDIVGPLPVTENGDRYIVSMIDRFSRYCMLVPTKDMKAYTVVKALEKWVTIFGPPDKILSDNGSQFLSDFYTTFNKSFKTKMKYTTAYHPQCNGMIERLHRWIKERLTLISLETNKDFIAGDDWAEYLPLIQWSYNTTPSRMTNHSPQEIIFGQSKDEVPQMPTDEELRVPTNPAKYIEYMNKRRNIIESKANKYQQFYDEDRTKYRNVISNNNPATKFQVGDLVMYYTGDQNVGNVKKLSSNWLGPFEITRIYNSGMNAEIVNVNNTGWSFPTHINKLKMWRTGNEQYWMESPLVYTLETLNGKIDEARENQLKDIENKFNSVNTRQQIRYDWFQKQALKPNNDVQIVRCVNTMERLLDVKQYIKN